MEPPAPTPEERRRLRAGDGWSRAVELFFDVLTAAEAGLIAFGVLALGIGLPLLVVAGGAAPPQAVRPPPACRDGGPRHPRGAAAHPPGRHAVWRRLGGGLPHRPPHRHRPRLPGGPRGPAGARLRRHAAPRRAGLGQKP